MDIENIAKVQNAAGAATTKTREWWGWFGCAVWMFFMMYGFDVFVLPDFLSYESASTWYPFFFMAVFALALAIFGWRFGQDPSALSKIAFYTAPIAMVITAVFVFLPCTAGSVLYAVSPLFMAPAVARRIYGVIRTAAPDKRLTRFMSAAAVCVAAFTAWLIIELPKETAFLVPALFIVPVWLGIRHKVTLPQEPLAGGAFRVSKKLLFMLAAAFVLLFWLDAMGSVIHTNIINAGLGNAEMIITLLGFLLPPLGFVFYGILSDKGQERAGFICGMMLFLTGIVIAVLPGDAQAPLLIPLAIGDGLGAAYTEFFILTIPIYFLAGSKRPVFMASLGLAVWLFCSTLLYISGIWLPEALRTFGIAVLVAAAVSAIGFVVLVWFIFERQREKTLAAALYSLLRGVEEAIPAAEGEKVGPAADNGFTKEEKAVALLLTEGLTPYEISRKLRLPSAEVGKHLKTLREKVAGISDSDPKISAIIRQYRLTGRETDMLHCLCRGMSNPEIAAEHYLSAETVKIHVRNLLKKLPVENRSEVAAWMEGLGEKGP